jgi:xylulokinase
LATEPTASSLLGLDVGTSGCKATVVAADGRVLGTGYQEYAALSTPDGGAELDAEVVWAAVRTVLARSLAPGLARGVRAISVSSFGETVVPIDRAGRALRPGILYFDRRGGEAAERLGRRLGPDRILALTGTAPHPMYSICKIMWLREHEPELYARTWKFLFFADFVLFRLGAPPCTDHSLAARSMAFEVVAKRWSPELLAAAEVPADRFGEAVPSGTGLGRIAPGLAAELGLAPEVLLVAGGHDQACAALGAGAIRPGLASNGMGSTECITPCFDHPVINAQMAASAFACVPHVRPGHYVTYAFSFTCGSLLRWYRDQFGAAQVAEAARRGLDPYQVLIEQALPDPNGPLRPTGPSGLYVLPHFAGAATPYMDGAAVGAMVGLDLDTRPARIILGILEGVTFEMRVNLARLAEAGVPIRELRATGGLARSERMLQLKADMMGLPVRALAVSEAGTLGVAILAGTACGIYASLEEGVDRLVRLGRSFLPDPERHQRYQEAFRVYQRLYPAVRSVYGR